MKITFLGTGTSGGVPMIACTCEVCRSSDVKDKRLRSSIFIESGTTNIAIDCGPDFREQMLRLGIRKLDAIVFTHAHKDHTAGLDDVRAFNFFQQKPMPVYASSSALDALKKEYYYVFGEHQYPGIPELSLHIIQKDRNFRIGDITLMPIEVMHAQLRVLAFRIGNFSYITDSNYISEESKEKIKGSEVLVLNALRKEKHVSHFTLGEAVALAKELKPTQTFFTHISHQLGLHSVINQELPANMKLAYDNLTIEL